MSRNSKERNKALKQKYKEMKPPMGVVAIRNKQNGKILIDISRDVRGTFNRDRFTLRLGTHLNKQLQKDWNKHGEEAFSFEVLAELEYDETTNINEELELLKMICLDKLPNQDEVIFY